MVLNLIGCMFFHPQPVEAVESTEAADMPPGFIFKVTHPSTFKGTPHSQNSLKKMYVYMPLFTWLTPPGPDSA